MVLVNEVGLVPVLENLYKVVQSSGLISGTVHRTNLGKILSEKGQKKSLEITLEFLAPPLEGETFKIFIKYADLQWTLNK